MLSVYPDGSLFIEFTINEIDLAGINEGAPVEIEFLWNEGEQERLPGVITFISLISSYESGEASYTARARFNADDSVRLGMTAVVYTVDESESDDEEEMPAASEEMEEQPSEEEGWETAGERRLEGAKKDGR